MAWDSLGYRLPTEAEWEKAARGGLDGQHFPWASPAEQNYEQLITHEQANFSGGKWQATSPAKAFPANGFGLFDMAGNVWEWCWDVWESDCYGERHKRGVVDPLGADSAVRSDRVFRGGCFADDARILRCSFRDGFLPAIRYGYRGFRVARGRIKPRRERSEGGDEGSGEGRARP